MPQQDPARDVLDTVQASPRLKAAAWDAFYKAQDEASFKQAFDSLPLPNEAKAALWDAKFGRAPQPAAATAPPEAASAGMVPASTPTERPQQAPASQAGGGILQTGANVVKGVAKGAANTAIGLGEAANTYIPGVGAANRAIYGRDTSGDYAAARKEFATPEGTAQKVGFHGEQIGEFFIPTGAAGKVGKAAEVAKAAGLTKAQGGTNTEAAASGAITAAIPGAAAARRGLASIAGKGAEKEVTRAILQGGGTAAAKETASGLAPEMIKRGVRGTSEQMLAQARAKVSAVGQQIGDAYKKAAAEGVTIPGQGIRDAIKDAAESLTTVNAKGKPVLIEGTQAVAARLGRLDKFVKDLGPDISADHAGKIKTMWDKIVSKAGLYGPKAAASATDSADAWAFREASNSIRQILSQATPDIAALNKEFAFWKGLKDVISQTERRKIGHAGVGLLPTVGGGSAGAFIGSAAGGPAGAAVGAMITPKLVAAIRSPWFRTSVSAPLKKALADALASGNAQRLESITGKILAAAPARAGQ